MNDNISGWNTWSNAIEDWTDVSICELHGLMTGLMTACNAPTEQEWATVLAELSFAPLPDAALTLLTEEAEDTVFQLKDKDDAYAYTPLVPDDEHDLYERVMALKQWANGFMTGFGITDCRLTSEENEMLMDLAKIGGIRLEEDEEYEGGEESYLYIYEFARMVPVSFATRKRKPVKELALISGLAMDAKTTKELQAEGKLPKPMPHVLDVMNQNNPS
ncbi:MULTISPECIES: UPF0149 family protein [unclassified Psychrobacter]|uniref:UPF0149 family protein n=1 Tax=unclassified Psychrobacter TaxID=196806 RepID=UPI00078DB609|nr:MULTISPECIES: UPF0149 family protein [unclassified Psychrobacter]AMN50376.1 hypothetical protein AK823_11270 [Psychrobacter sp. P2G3]AMN68274.1 hypothetical protein AK825_11700 [Psychrobacter sp. P11G5]